MVIKDSLMYSWLLKIVPVVSLLAGLLHFPLTVRASDTINLTQVHVAYTLECGTDLMLFDKGGESANGVYPDGYATTNWIYIRTPDMETPIHISYESSLASNCSLTFFEAYPTNDQTNPTGFSTAYPGTCGIDRAETGTSSNSFVVPSGKVCIRFTKSNVTGARTCNFRIHVWTSDTSEVYDIRNADVTSTSARLSWSDSSDASQWTVCYGLSSATLNLSTVVNATTVTLSDLIPNRQYYVRVYNNANTTQAMSGMCTPNNTMFVTKGATPVPTGCFGDFTDLTSDNVICTYGYYSNPDETYGIVSNRHTVMTDTTTCDPIVGDSLRVIPSGTAASVRLGNSSCGNQAESIVYRFQVDTNQSDMLLLRYAAVMQNPNNHAATIQPRFQLEILREDGSEIDDNCYKADFVASSVIDSMSLWHNHGHTSGSDYTVVWCDWNAVGVDLAPMQDEVLYVKLTTKDCNASATTYGGEHFGYAYFTLECGRKTLTYKGCNDNPDACLLAPDGFRYDWREQGSDVTLSTSRELQIPLGTTSKYECIMSFRGSTHTECSFTMAADPTMLRQYPHALFSAPFHVASGDPVTFTNASFISTDMAGTAPNDVASFHSFHWNFGDGQTSSETNPTHVFPVSSRDHAYPVELVCSVDEGCESTTNQTVLVAGTGVYDPNNSAFDDCLVPDTASSDWTAPVLDWSSSDQLSSYTIPLVGDLNGDGYPEIVCFGIGTSSQTKIINAGQGHQVNSVLAIFDGATRQRLPLTETLMKNSSGTVVYADEFGVAPYGILRTKYLGTDIDTGLIIVATTRTGSNPTYYSGSANRYYLQAYDIHGVNIWTSSASWSDSTTTRRRHPVAVSFADFNGDGYPEVYVSNLIFDAATGVLLAEVKSPNHNRGESWAHKCGTTNYYGILSAPFAADVTGDGLPELILGNEAYHIEITNRSGTSGNTVTLAARHDPPTNYTGIPNDGHTQVADFNGDGYLDVLVTLRPSFGTSSYTYCYVWDVHNDRVSQAARVFYNNNGGKSIPLVADIDNDGAMDVVIQGASNPSSTGSKIKALRYNVATNAFSTLWEQSYEEDSWSNTMTMFDFNGDGENELLLSSRDGWRVLKGTDGTSVNLINRKEVTIMDYPVIADVDNDGSAEILTIDSLNSTSGRGYLHIWKSGGEPWKAARPVWNQYMYNVTNVNDDLTIPSSPINNAERLTDPDGVIRQPYNHFLQQVGRLDMYGRPAQYAADIAVELNGEVVDDDMDLTIPLRLCNIGQADAGAPIPISVYSGQYRGDIVSAGVFEVTTPLPIGDCVDYTVTLSKSLLCTLSMSNVMVAVNDQGDGVAQNGGLQYECDTVNNLLSVAFSSCNDIDSVQTVENCGPYQWPLDGTFYSQSTDEPTVRLTGHNGDPDTLVTLHLTVYSPTAGDTTATACDSFTWHDVTYTETPAVAPTYTTTGSNGCDSVITLHLTINNPVHTATTESACESYTWNGTDYTVSGNYTYSHADANGCQQVDTLHLTINNPVHTATTESACESYTWNGTEYTVSGDYTYSHTDANGCTQVDTLHLTINNPVHTATIEIACETYTWNGTNYTTSGNYTYPHLDANGCQQVDTLHLTINNPVHTATTETACESYTWNGTDYTVSGDYTYPHLDANGCTQVDTLQLTINYGSYQSVTEEVCDSYEWERGDGSRQEYTNSTYEVYRYTLMGCASADTLHLTVRNSSHNSMRIAICDSYTWERPDGTSETYTLSDTYVCSYTNIWECASADTLHLTVNHGDSRDTVATACDSYAWDRTGETYDQNGSYPYRYDAEGDGCEDTITLHLTLNSSTAGDTTATACDSFTWHDETYTETPAVAPTYTTTDSHGCDSTVTLHLTLNHSTTSSMAETACSEYYWQPLNRTLEASGEYVATGTNADGCPHTDSLLLTIIPIEPSEISLSVCEGMYWGGAYRNASGDYTADSTVGPCVVTNTLHLTVYHGVHTDIEEHACDSYLWRQTGLTYNESGIYDAYDDNVQGCRDTVSLHLTIHQSQAVVERLTACDSAEWHGTWFYQDNHDATYQTVDINGCDSITTLDLTLRASSRRWNAATVCDSMTWHGRTYHQSDTLVYTTENMQGCDSVEYLVLTVNYSVSSVDFAEACDSYDWYEYHNITVSTDEPVHRFNSVSGCDSIVSLSLTLHYSVVTEQEATSCGSYVWGGATYTQSGVYSHHATTLYHCDSTIRLQLTIYPAYQSHFYDTLCNGESYHFNGETYDSPGDYSSVFSTIQGCDSTVHLHLIPLTPPLFSLDAVTDCETERWILQGRSDLELIYHWTASHNARQIEEVEYDQTISFYAYDSTVVTLHADYAHGHSCPGTRSVVVRPIHHVTAQFDSHPEALDRDHRHLLAVDASSGATGREWLIDGINMSEAPIFEYDADFDTRELLLTLVAYNDYCYDTASRRYTIASETLFIPNTFTPDLSTNNFFRAFGTGIYEFEMDIYNREGLKVFHADNMEQAWDGTHDGTPCPQASYVYRVRYRGEMTPEGYQFRSGTVLLLR